MKKIGNIHNNFFLKLLSDKNNAVDFLNISLPIELKKSIDINNIKYSKNSFISPKLKSTYQDIILKTTTIDKNSLCDIYILIEHKSSLTEEKRSKYFILLQILKYIYLMLDNDINNNIEPRIIIPLIFYHGKEKWDIPNNFNDIFNINTELKNIYSIFNTFYSIRKSLILKKREK